YECNTVPFVTARHFANRAVGGGGQADEGHLAAIISHISVWPSRGKPSVCVPANSFGRKTSYEKTKAKAKTLLAIMAAQTDLSARYFETIQLPTDSSDEAFFRRDQMSHN